VEKPEHRLATRARTPSIAMSRQSSGMLRGVARSIAALRESSDAELIRERDEIAPHAVPGTDFNIQELFRRSAERAGEKAQDLAVKVYRLTIASTCLSVIAVFAAVIALCR